MTVRLGFNVKSRVGVLAVLLMDLCMMTFDAYPMIIFLEQEIMSI